MDQVIFSFHGDDHLMGQIETRARSGVDPSLNLMETDPTEVLLADVNLQQASSGRSLLSAELTEDGSWPDGLPTPLLPTAYGLLTVVDWLRQGHSPVNIEFPEYGDLVETRLGAAGIVSVRSLEVPDIVFETTLSSLDENVRAFVAAVRVYVQEKAPSVLVDTRVPAWIRESVLGQTLS